MKSKVLFVLLLLSGLANSQTNYDDVAVIVNLNSQTSIDIGIYFKNARNIPTQNMIFVSAPTSEIIDSTQFEAVRAQIEDYLVSNNLEDSINYLVTTKGVPLRVLGNCIGIQGASSNCASFDSELALILGPYADKIALNGSFQNPLYSTSQHFSRENTGFYLVTRLDGYTKQDVFSLIDRSGPETGVNQISARNILDLNNATGGDSIYFVDNYLAPVNTYLTAVPWNAETDWNFDPLLAQNNVLSYQSTGHGPLLNVDLNYAWVEGSFTTLATCRTATTFDLSTNTPGALLVANLIEEGCTGALGYVDCIYFSNIPSMDILVQRYLDQTENYNLAESFYMAEKNLSWQAVVVGDPKASLVVDNFASLSTIGSETLSIYPNPSAGMVHVNGSEAIASAMVYDLNGSLVRNFEALQGNSVDLDLSELGAGVYILQVETAGSFTRERIVIQR